MEFNDEEQTLNYLRELWGEEWEIERDPHGEWVANRQNRLDDDEIRAGIEMSLVADDLPTLHDLLHEQDRVEQKFQENRARQAREVWRQERE